jgi:uncharacterized protein DUF3187
MAMPVLLPGRGFAVLLSAAMLAEPVWAQGLPEVTPLNPVGSSRSGVYFQPLRQPSPGRWVTNLAMDYGSAIEYNNLPRGSYILDSELLRITFGVSRDLSSRIFLKAAAAVSGSYSGFMDGFLDWYHGALGIRMGEREKRPRDSFLYEMPLPGGGSLERRADALFVQDLRFGLGVRIHPLIQTVLSSTLPTSTGPAGYGRGVPSISLLNTVGRQLSERTYFEGSVGVGYTPATGVLREVQNTKFLALTSGLRVAVWGRQSLFANLFYHSPYYRETTFPALDRNELSLDFGWIHHAPSGGEWRIGMTEDLKPSGPGIDLILRFGRTF